MILALDVHYQTSLARVGVVAFHDWSDSCPTHEWVTEVSEVLEYEPGEFYRRELPCLMAGLDIVPDDINELLTAVIVDGYVWLDRDGRPGLGAHLFDSLGEVAAVIGVAKNEFAGNDAAVPVLRGDSKRPLYVTAVGVDVADAAAAVAGMHGEYRFPTLLRRVDELSRGY